jgi:hypothetical protein
MTPKRPGRARGPLNVSTDGMRRHEIRERGRCQLQASMLSILVAGVRLIGEPSVGTITNAAGSGGATSAAISSRSTGSAPPGRRPWPCPGREGSGGQRRRAEISRRPPGAQRRRDRPYAPVPRDPAPRRHPLRGRDHAIALTVSGGRVDGSSPYSTNRRDERRHHSGWIWRSERHERVKCAWVDLEPSATAVRAVRCASYGRARCSRCGRSNPDRRPQYAEPRSTPSRAAWAAHAGIQARAVSSVAPRQ